MPSIEKHVEISQQRTNQSHREVHEWIDDPQHKEERHDIEPGKNVIPNPACMAPPSLKYG